MTLVSALLKYFGKKENQTLAQFAQEFKALTSRDKVELAEMLTKELGVPIEVEGGTQ